LEDIARFVGHAEPTTTAGYVKRLGRRPQSVAERAAAILDDDVRPYGPTVGCSAAAGSDEVHGHIAVVLVVPASRPLTGRLGSQPQLLANGRGTDGALGSGPTPASPRTTAAVAGSEPMAPSKARWFTVEQIGPDLDAH
jgi:hypothetical protein